MVNNSLIREWSIINYKIFENCANAISIQDRYENSNCLVFELFQYSDPHYIQYKNCLEIEIDKFAQQTPSKLQAWPAQLFQQGQEMGRHVEHEDRISKKDRPSGEKFFRV